MDFKLQPYPHQIEGIELSKKFRDIGLFWEMGTGKTGGLINILRDKYNQSRKLKRTLILSPLVTLFNWKEEFKIHSSIDQDKILVLHRGGSAGKIRDFNKAILNRVTGELDQDMIVITNYESLNSEKMYNLFAEYHFDIIVADEAHYIKNPKAIRSKAVVKLGDKAINRFILTGTPILNSVKDVYNLFRFLDKGETFGKNVAVFMNTYMEDENAGWKGSTNHFSKWVARPETYALLTEKIYRKCHRVLKVDVLKDLPPLIKTVRHVQLGKKQMQYYKEMERDFVTFVQEKKAANEMSGSVIAQLAITKALRLQQIVSGYVSTDDGEEIIIEDNPRIKATEELLKEIVIDGGHKCILWCSFRQNYKMLGKLCTELGINHVYLTGDMNLTQKQEAMNDFNTGDADIIISNRRAGGIGVNLVAASYSIVYSRNFSLGEELQSEARNHRGGSQIHEKITKIDLCADGTTDETVLEALKNKENVSKMIIDMVKNL